jgi:hypothetical protein
MLCRGALTFSTHYLPVSPCVAVYMTHVWVQCAVQFPELFVQAEEMVTGSLGKGPLDLTASVKARGATLIPVPLVSLTNGRNLLAKLHAMFT